MNLSKMTRKARKALYGDAKFAGDKYLAVYEYEQNGEVLPDDWNPVAGFIGWFVAMHRGAVGQPNLSTTDVERVVASFNPSVWASRREGAR